MDGGSDPCVVQLNLLSPDQTEITLSELPLVYIIYLRHKRLWVENEKNTLDNFFQSIFFQSAGKQMKNTFHSTTAEQNS